MSEITQDVIEEAGGSSAPVTGPEPEALPIEGASQGAEAEPPESDAKGLIPRSRYNEAAQQRDDLKAQLDTQAAKEQQILNQVQQVMLRNQQLEQHVNQLAVPPSEATIDPVEDAIKKQLGTDEAGEEAWKTLNQFHEHKMAQNGFITADQATELINQGIGTIRGNITSATGATNKIAEWQKSGMINAEVATKMSNEMAGLMQKNPGLANNPANVQAVLTQLYVREQENGFRPTFQAAATPVMGPSQGGGNATPPAVKITPEAMQGFVRLKGASQADLDKLDALSATNYNSAYKGGR